MNIPEALRYTRDHEWTADESGRLRMGITEYAQDALGAIVFVQLPEVGAHIQVGMTFSEVESTKSVSDIYAPVSGTVVAINEQLVETPQVINTDPYEGGWICIIEPEADTSTDHFLTAEGYRGLVGEG